MAKTSAQKDLQKHWAKQAKDAQKPGKSGKRLSKAKDATRGADVASGGKEKPGEPQL